MKLYVFFILMDLLTVLAYPVVFVHGKLRQLAKLKNSSDQPGSLVVVPIPSAG